MRVIQSFSIFDENVIEVRADGEEDTPLLGFLEPQENGRFKATTVKGEVYIVESRDRGIAYLMQKRESRKPAPKKEVVKSQINLF